MIFCLNEELRRLWLGKRRVMSGCGVSGWRRQCKGEGSLARRGQIWRVPYLADEWLKCYEWRGFSNFLESPDGASASKSHLEDRWFGMDCSFGNREDGSGWGQRRVMSGCGAGLVVSRRSGFAYSGCPIRQKVAFAYSGCPIRQKVARPIMCISPRFILQS